MNAAIISNLIISAYKTAQTNAKAAAKYGANSVELFNALTAVIEVNGLIELYGLEKEAGMTYGNVWD